MAKQFNQIKTYARSKNLPLIPINSNDVSIINDPSQFYKSIIEGIKSCKQSLALSALYLGTGPKEQEIVNEILYMLHRNSKLSVNVILDANRAIRPDRAGESSISILEPILPYENTRLNLINCRPKSRFYKNWFKFPKVEEILSTYHAKLMLFDDNVIVTGANLSDIYFNQRRDRYMMFKHSPQLSQYFYGFLDVISHTDNISVDSISSYNRSYVQATISDEVNVDSYVIPLTQCGTSGITQKEDFLIFLGSILPDRSRIYMSSGYFNPSPVIDGLNIDSILAPSESANGFYKGSGLLRYVPRLYSTIHSQYLNKHPSTELFLYDTPNWSFHAKGIWVEGLKDVYIHFIGSSNFNCRSSKRDFETQLVLITKDKTLVSRLIEERNGLWMESKRTDLNDIGPTNSLYKVFSRLLKTFL